MKPFARVCACTTLTLAATYWPEPATAADPPLWHVSTTQRLEKIPLHAQAQRVQLNVPAGQVVQIRFHGAGLHLDLRNAKGEHLRRLAENGRGTQTALWHTQGPQHEQLWVVAAQPDAAPYAFSLQVLNTWTTSSAEPSRADATPMGPRLQALQQALAQGQSTAAFWQQVQQQGTPLIEPWERGQLLVTFLWRDQGNQNVRLFGSPSRDHNHLQRLPNSDVWWSSVVMDPRAQLSYAFAPDVPLIAQAGQQRRMILSTLQRDPLNPQRFPAQSWSHVTDRYQGRSVVRLPQAVQPAWLQAQPTSPHGKLTRHVLSSHILDNERDVWTYVPAGAAPQALLVLFDAHAFVHDVPTPHILDNLIASGVLPPTAAVIIGNASPEARGQELPPNPAFARFMAEELMPWVQSQKLAQPPEHTVIAGSSYGGLASSYMALTHPELFGNVLSMSGSYWWAPKGEPPGWMQRAWQTLAAPLPTVKFYLDAGRYETGRGERAGIFETTAELSQILTQRGVPVSRQTFEGGHDYLQWQISLGCGLTHLLAPQQLTHPHMQACANR